MLFTQIFFYNIVLAGILTLFVAAAPKLLYWMYIGLRYGFRFFDFYKLVQKTKGDVNGFSLKRNDKITFTCKKDKSVITGHVIGFYTNSNGTRYLVVKQLNLTKVEAVRIDDIGSDLA